MSTHDALRQVCLTIRPTPPSRPKWLAKSACKWQEDDARPEGAETLSEAWLRFTGRQYEPCPFLEEYDGGDAFFRLYPGGWVAVVSYPGNNEIRRLETGPCLLRRWNRLEESWQYAGETPDGGVRVFGSKGSAKTFDSPEAAQVWQEERPYFARYDLGPTNEPEARSLPPEDEDEPDSENRERVAGMGDIGRGPDLIGSDLPRFASRVKDEREMD
jgi:hypothetical protein